MISSDELRRKMIQYQERVGSMREKSVRSKRCKCLAECQKELAKMGVRFETGLSVNFKTGKGTIVGPFLKVEWVDKPKRRTKLPTVMCTYCPTCGRKLE